MTQSAKAGSNSTIVQAGRDAILHVEKCPPEIRLVRIHIDDNHEFGTLRQRINVIIKNNGDKTAFLMKGMIMQDEAQTIRLCNQIGMQFSLSRSDWIYDIDITDDEPRFVGQHSIAPNEVVNFDVMVGRKEGGHEPTVYRCHLLLEFDEGDDLKTDSFHLMISGPVVWQGGFQAQGPTPEEWGHCQADNIRRLLSIGYDFRDQIDSDSRKYVEAVAPGIFDE